jgi:hypothetical protein
VDFLGECQSIHGITAGVGVAGMIPQDVKRDVIGWGMNDILRTYFLCHAAEFFDELVDFLLGLCKIRVAGIELLLNFLNLLLVARLRQHRPSMSNLHSQAAGQEVQQQLLTRSEWRSGFDSELR